MTCPRCGTPGTSVTKTMDSGNSIQRRRLCACGWMWTTREIEMKGTGAFMAINDCGQKTLVARSEGGDIDLLSSPGSSPLKDPDRSERRANWTPYSAAFETCWREYGRREEKVKAYARWKIEAKLLGNEEALRDLVLKALAWQGPMWERDGWRFAKYFERYLKARKWQDEPPLHLNAPQRDRGRRSRGDETVDNLREMIAGGSK